MNTDRPQFRCTRCGHDVLMRLLHLTSLDPDGRVDFHHIREGIACGPVVTNFLLPQTGKTRAPVGGWSAPKTLASTHLPWQFGPEGIDMRATLRLIERTMIARALKLAGTEHGTVERAARLLRTGRTTFAQKLRRYGWERTWLTRPPRKHAAAQKAVTG